MGIGIKTFCYSRGRGLINGLLVAIERRFWTYSLDMRTERQLLEMIKAAWREKVSVVVSRLQEFDFCFGDGVHYAMLLVNPPSPTAG
jgi:hypothetical protein